MKQEKTYIKGGTAAIKFGCAALFLLFSFVYLNFYQADLLAMAQHVWSYGKTHYNAFIGAVIITGVLYLLHIGVFAVTKLSKSWHSITYFPSFLALSILTSVDESITPKITLGAWIWIIPLVLLGFAGLVYIGKQLEQFDSVSITDGRMWRRAWINLLTMCLMMLGTGLIGTGNKQLHQRLKIESLIEKGKYDEALRVADKAIETDSSLTMLRFYALSNSGQLGDKLFTYQLKGRAEAIYPNDSTVKPLLLDAQVMRRHYKLKRYYYEMLLNRYLLNKNLDAFARELVRQDSTLNNLPRHYREALVLYNRVKSNPVVNYNDSVLSADFADFNDLIRKTKKQERIKKVQKVYGNTYWYYYKFE